MKFRAADTRTLAECIAEAEARTQAELVLVIRRSSGNYRDADYLFGAVLAFGVLCFKLFSPFEFHPLSIPLPLVLCFVGGAWVSRRLGIRRWLTTRKRRNEQVRKAAFAAYLERGIDRTKRGTGLLLYWSILEKRAELIADRGVREALGADRLEEQRARLESAFEAMEPVLALGALVRSLGVLLGRALPPVADDVDELDNTPELATGEDS